MAWARLLHHKTRMLSILLVKLEIEDTAKVNKPQMTRLAFFFYVCVLSCAPCMQLCCAFFSSLSRFSLGPLHEHFCVQTLSTTVEDSCRRLFFWWFCFVLQWFQWIATLVLLFALGKCHFEGRAFDLQTVTSAKVCLPVLLRPQDGSRKCESVFTQAQQAGIILLLI